MTIEIHSERLLLRPHDSSDVELDVEMGTDDEVMKYFGGAVTREDMLEEVSNFTRRCAGGCIGVWTVLDRATQERLGEAFLLPLPIDEEDTQWELVNGDELPPGEIELGYLFKRSAWGRGYATEMCQSLLQFAFRETPLPDVVAVIEPGNAASQRVLEKCGFVYEGKRQAYAEQMPGFRLSRERFMDRLSVSA